MSRGPRFSIIPARALRDPNLSNSAKLVLAVMGQYCNDRAEWIFPSQSTIAEQIGGHRVTVNKAIKELTTAGYLLSRPRFDEETKSRRSNEYFILYDAPPCSETLQTPVADELQAPVAPGLHITNPDLTIPEDSCVLGKKNDYPKDFQAFWKEWTAQHLHSSADSKKQAFKEWKRLTNYQKILAGRHAQIFQRKFKADYPKASMKHAERYLKHGNFEDIEPPPKRIVMLKPGTPEYEAEARRQAEAARNPSVFHAFMDPQDKLYNTLKARA